MKKLALSLAALAALVWLGFDSSTAQASNRYRGFGIHLGGRNLHLDIGNPHGRHGYHRYRSWHRGPVHYDWHDTSHWDYHPPSLVPHGNHYDFVPGHYDYHRTGHWDRHRGYHHW